MQAGEEPELWSLFHHTIRRVNIRDYSEEQVRAWAPDQIDEQRWQQRMASINPFVAVIDGEIVGYADVQDDGLVDHFFCHHRHQGLGVGRALMTHLIRTAVSRGLTRMYSNVSITARPFFEHFGFTVETEQKITIGEISLTNYRMSRLLPDE